MMPTPADGDWVAGTPPEALLSNEDAGRVRRVLAKRRKTVDDFALLLSPGGEQILEELAQTARQITLGRFGRAVQLYAPLYLSNHCVGLCPYCGFSAKQSIGRRTLDVGEIEVEAMALKETGMSHVLLVAGESPGRLDIPLLADIVRRLKTMFCSVTLEIAPQDQPGYAQLVQAGADGITLYQETYDEQRYHRFHHRGPKADYAFRLGALDRAGAVGMRCLTVGALWGLSPWRSEAYHLGRHARKLQHSWWKSQVSIGLPRLHSVPSGFDIPFPMADRSLAQVIAALRIFLPDAGLVLSTRESPVLREGLVHLGITQLSAGSKTEPGGYTRAGQSGEQFPVTDDRSPAEVASSLCALGYDPVWKDWDPAFGRRQS